MIVLSASATPGIIAKRSARTNVLSFIFHFNSSHYNSFYELLLTLGLGFELLIYEFFYKK